jgi:inosose dehydratase
MDLSRTLTRRRFLQAGAAAAVALPAAVRAADKDDALGGFKLGVQSYTFRDFNTEQALKRIQDLGLHYVEFFPKHAPLDSTPAQVQALRKLCGDYGVTPVAFGVQRFTKDHDANKKVFEFGKQLGVESLSADPDPDSFDSLDKLVAEYQIAIAIHPHGPAGRGQLHRWYSAETILAAVKDHHALLGSCLDTGHLIRAEILGKKLDPAAEIRLMGARNFGLHLKDNDNAREKAGAGGGSSNVVFGKGALDVPGVLRALRDVKYARAISIEYEANPKDPSADMRACVEAFKQAVRSA